MVSNTMAAKTFHCTSQRKTTYISFLDFFVCYTEEKLPFKKYGVRAADKQEANQKRPSLFAVADTGGKLMAFLGSFQYSL